MNLTDTQAQPSDQETLRLTMLILYITFMIIGSIGNGLVLAVVTTKKGPRSDNDVFLICLACADLLYIYFIDGMSITYQFDKTTKSIFYCKCVFPMATVTFCAGIFTITSMAIQRCRVILNPWRPKTRLCFINLWVMGIWLGSVVVILPGIIFAEPAGIACTVKMPPIPLFDITYATALFAVEYPIPLIIITIAYVKIGLYLRKPRIPSDSIIARGNRARTSRCETRRESIQITKTLGVIVLLFAVLMLPVQIAWMAWTYEKSPWVLFFWRYSDMIANVHSCLNPIIYGVLTKRFRRQYYEWFRRVCSSFRRGECTNRYQERRVSPTYYNGTNIENELRSTGSCTIKVPEQQNHSIAL